MVKIIGDELTPLGRCLLLPTVKPYPGVSTSTTAILAPWPDAGLAAMRPRRPPELVGLQDQTDERQNADGICDSAGNTRKKLSSAVHPARA